MNRKDLKDYQKFIYSLPAQGWQVKLRKGGHYKLIPPWKSAELIFAPASPSDRRVLKNIIAQVKRAHRENG
jgi:predicted RNA binding protein YcfA (HicA-like mRNA interferase family)